MSWANKNVTPAEVARRKKYNSREHKNAGTRFTALIATGQASCWRCGRHIPPGTPRAYRGKPGWVVGHDDHHINLIRGPECYPCNKQAADRKGAQVANALRKTKTTRARTPPRRPPTTAPRDWT